MPQFVKEFSGVDTSELIAYLDKSQEPMRPSEIYIVSTATKVVDVDQRVSEFRLFHDKEIFAICAKILNKLTEHDKLNKLELWENDVTEIVYKAGGKFDEHRDYLSVTSNCLEEYTLLINCNRAEDEAAVGGETRVVVNPLFELVSKATVTSNSALLFRKDLVHQGMPVLGGTKRIVSLNVWVTKKDPESSQVMYFTFSAQAETPGSSCRLEAAASKSYAVLTSAIARFPSSHLNQHIQWSTIEGAERSPVVHYEVPAPWTFESFRPVYQVLTGAYVSPEACIEHVACLDYFNIKVEQILVSISNVGNSSHEVELLRALGRLKPDEAEALLPSQHELPRIPLGLATDSPSCSLCGRVQEQAPDPAHVVLSSHGVFFCSGDCSDTVAANKEIARANGSNSPKAPSRLSTLMRKYTKAAETHAASSDDEEEEEEEKEDDKMEATFEFSADAETDEYGHFMYPMAPPSKRDQQLARRKARDDLRPPILKSFLSDEDIIVCTNDEMTRVLAEIARVARLPYVRFRVIFVEGPVRFGGDMGVEMLPVQLHMLPCFAAVGDYDSVLMLQNVFFKGAPSDKDVPHEFPLLRFLQKAIDPHEAYKLTAEEKRALLVRDEDHDLTRLPRLLQIPDEPISLTFNCFHHPNNYGQVSGDGDTDVKKVKTNEVLLEGLDYELDCPLWMSLVLSVSQAKIKPKGQNSSPETARSITMAEVISLVAMYPDDDAFSYHVIPSAIALPGGGSWEGSSDEQHSPGMFHIDAAHKSCFTLQEAQDASKHLIDSDFLGVLKNRIKTTSFTFPQEHEAVSHHYCNESVYGQFTFLEMTGLVKLG